MEVSFRYYRSRQRIGIKIGTIEREVNNLGSHVIQLYCKHYKTLSELSKSYNVTEIYLYAPFALVQQYIIYAP